MDGKPVNKLHVWKAKVSGSISARRNKLNWVGRSFLFCALAYGVFVAPFSEDYVRLNPKKVSSSQLENWNNGVDPVIDRPFGRMPRTLPGPLDVWAGGIHHSLEVSVPHKKEENVWLTLNLCDAHETSPPRIVIFVNGRKVGETRVKPGTGKGEVCQQANQSLTLKFHLPMAKGLNLIRIENNDGSWIKFHSINITGKPTTIWGLIHSASPVSTVVLMIVGIMVAVLGGIIFGPRLPAPPDSA